MRITAPCLFLFESSLESAAQGQKSDPRCAHRDFPPCRGSRRDRVYTFSFYGLHHHTESDSYFWSAKHSILLFPPLDLTRLFCVLLNFIFRGQAVKNPDFNWGLRIQYRMEPLSPRLFFRAVAKPVLSLDFRRSRRTVPFLGTSNGYYDGSVTSGETLFLILPMTSVKYPPPQPFRVVQNHIWPFLFHPGFLGRGCPVLQLPAWNRCSHLHLCSHLLKLPLPRFLLLLSGDLFLPLTAWSWLRGARLPLTHSNRGYHCWSGLARGRSVFSLDFWGEECK